MLLNLVPYSSGDIKVRPVICHADTEGECLDFADIIIIIIIIGEEIITRGKVLSVNSRGADKSLARPGRKQATATEDFDFHTSHL